MSSSPNHPKPADKPYAANLVGFLEDPVKYRPLDEFLNLILPDEETVLTHCIKNVMIDAVDALLTYGADPNLSSRKGVTPISAAAHKGNIVMMHRLILAGAAVNAINQSGSTALIQAAHFGHLPAVKLLLAHNASSDFANVKGTTALMRACQEGHLEISKCLLESDVEVNRKNHEGMNALMLASQRGHADIVLLLIKAGATMDEQTTQGSTALMLACKRGHGKCVETLVSMGAEICMKDRRGRTAKDTATRREHTALLQWLDTQVQVKKIQQSRHVLRHQHLMNYRRASLDNVLVLNEVEAGVSELVDAVQRTRLEAMKLFKNRYAVRDEQLLREFRSSSSSARLSFLARSPEDTLGVIQGTLSNNRNPLIGTIPVYKKDIRLSLTHPGRADWMWCSLLNRCMSLPTGVFENIIDYLPMPRIWQWTLTRVKSRCKLSPYQAMLDICTIMDEILCDANIFAGADQTCLLMKINKSPQIHEYLVESMGMTQNLVDSLCQAGDVQGTLIKHRENDIIYKPVAAKQLLVIAVALYRWFRTQQSSVKMLGLILPSALNISGDNLHDLTGLRLNGSGVDRDLLTQDDAGDLMEETDAGGEGSEDNDEQDEDGDGEGDAGGAGGGAAGAVDPETENDDMLVEGADGDNILEDSDVDEADTQMMISGMI